MDVFHEASRNKWVERHLLAGIEVTGERKGGIEVGNIRHPPTEVLLLSSRRPLIIAFHLLN